MHVALQRYSPVAGAFGELAIAFVLRCYVTLTCETQVDDNEKEAAAKLLA